MTRRPEIPGQLEIWPAPQVPPKPRTVPKITMPKWSRYKAVRPVPCDFCKLNQRDDPLAPIARRARWRRRAPDGDDLYLCGPHASDQRVSDGMPSLRGVS